MGWLSDHVVIPAGTAINSGIMHSSPSAIFDGTQTGCLVDWLLENSEDIATQATEWWNNRDVQAQDEEDDEFEER